MNYTPEQISQIVLKILKEIETPDVLKLSCKKKLNLAQDPNTSTETLAVLAIDKNPDVRLEVADHPNTSTESLAILATDKNSFIRDVVSKHPNYKKQTLELTTKQYDALKKLIESSQDESLKGIV